MWEEPSGTALSNLPSGTFPGRGTSSHFPSRMLYRRIPSKRVSWSKTYRHWSLPEDWMAVTRESEISCSPAMEPLPGPFLSEAEQDRNKDRTQKEKIILATPLMSATATLPQPNNHKVLRGWPLRLMVQGPLWSVREQSYRDAGRISQSCPPPDGTAYKSCRKGLSQGLR